MEEGSAFHSNTFGTLLMSLTLYTKLWIASAIPLLLPQCGKLDGYIANQDYIRFSNGDLESTMIRTAHARDPNCRTIALPRFDWAGLLRFLSDIHDSLHIQ